MKVLLDENIPHALRTRITGHDVYTVRHKRWDRIRNGSLLALAGSEGFDVLVTMDAGFAHEQNSAALPVAVLILSAPSNRPEHVLPLAPKISAALDGMMPRTISHLR